MLRVFARLVNYRCWRRHVEAMEWRLVERLYEGRIWEPNELGNMRGDKGIICVLVCLAFLISQIVGFHVSILRPDDFQEPVVRHFLV